MLELLQNYSINQILIFIVMLALAIKGLISFWDWGYERLKNGFTKKFQKDKYRQDLEVRLSNYDKKVNQLEQAQNEMLSKLEYMLKKIDILTDSDKDSIKAYITEKHHFYCYNQKWIDDYSLDCLERRFEHYQNEHGNSFIEEMMTEIRALPRTPTAIQE